MKTRIVALALLGLSMYSSAALAQDARSAASDEPGIAVLGGNEPLPAPQVRTNPPPEGVVASTMNNGPKQRKAAQVHHAKVPPANLIVRSNINARFGIALYHANRILTPFRTPEIQTSSTAGISIEQGIVYITTDRPDPISMFIYDKADPASALSLTMIPQEMTPVSTQIRLEGYTGAPAGQYGKASDTTLANTFETEESYVSTLKTLFKGLALGKVPSGYGLQELRGAHPMMPSCNIPGLQVTPLQELQGNAIITLVAKATNYGYQAVEFNETACQSARVLATAAWPSPTIAPGQSVEVYIALRAPDESESIADRPSVLNRGR